MVVKGGGDYSADYHQIYCYDCPLFRVRYKCVVIPEVLTDDVILEVVTVDEVSKVVTVYDITEVVTVDI